MLRRRVISSWPLFATQVAFSLIFGSLPAFAVQKDVGSSLSALDTSVLKPFACETPAKDPLAAAVKAGAISQFCHSAEDEKLNSQLAENLAPTLKRIDVDAKDGFFALLASQQGQQLKCGEDYAQQVIDGNSQVTDDISNKLTQLWTLQMNVRKAADTIRTNVNIGNKSGCPATMQEFNDLEKRGYPEFQKENPFYESCKDLIANRVGVQLMEAMIPLSGTPAVQKYLHQIVSADFSPAQLKQIYSQAKKELLDERESLEAKVKNPNYRFDEPTQRALMSDPAVLGKVVQAGGRDLASLSCRIKADFDYEDKVKRGVMIASLVVPVAAGPVARGIGAVADFALAAETAAMVGQLSLTGARILQYAALGANSYGAVDKIFNACLEKAPGLRALSASSDSRCVSAPSIQAMEADNCLMTAALEGLGLGITGVTVLADVKRGIDAVRAEKALAMVQAREAAAAPSVSYAVPEMPIAPGKVIGSSRPSPSFIASMGDQIQSAIRTGRALKEEYVGESLEKILEAPKLKEIIVQLAGQGVSEAEVQQILVNSITRPSQGHSIGGSVGETVGEMRSPADGVNSITNGMVNTALSLSKVVETSK